MIVALENKGGIYQHEDGCYIYFRCSTDINIYIYIYQDYINAMLK